MSSATETSTRINAVDIESVAGLAGKIQESPEAASTVWKASVRWEEGFRSSASIRDFDPIGSDEPASLGGEQHGAQPAGQCRLSGDSGQNQS